jgi:hypothetical protein
VSLLVGLAAGGALLAYYAAFRHDVIPASLVEFNTQVGLGCLAPRLPAGHTCLQRPCLARFCLRLA